MRRAGALPRSARGRAHPRRWSGRVAVVALLLLAACGAASAAPEQDATSSTAHEHSLSDQYDQTPAACVEQNAIDHAKIIKAYISHVLSHEGTHFLSFDSDVASLTLSQAETHELKRLRDEVDAEWER